jgi:hypothetical protein
MFLYKHRLREKNPCWKPIDLIIKREREGKNDGSGTGSGVDIYICRNMKGNERRWETRKNKPSLTIKNDTTQKKKTETNEAEKQREKRRREKTMQLRCIQMDEMWMLF